MSPREICLYIFFIFDKDFKIKKHEIIVINDRIRDLKYLKKKKKLFYFRECRACNFKQSLSFQFCVNGNYTPIKGAII